MARKTKTSSLSIEEKLEQALIVPGYEPYKIPDNWCWTTFENIAKWGSGGTPSRKNIKYYLGEIPWIKTGELDNNIIYETEEHISEEAIVNSIAKIYPVNTVIIAMYGATIGKVGIMGVESTTNQACANAICRNNVYYKYLFYYAVSQKDAFIGKSKGGAQPNISQEIIKKHEFPLPPLPEQHRIVERIESLFSKLDEAKEKAQAVIDSFESRRAAILHKAFSGELTEKWRRENGVEFESWGKCKLIDVLIDKPRNGYSPKPVDYPTEVKSMTLSATTSGTFLPQYFKYIDEVIPNDSYLWLKKGDILVQRANSIDKVGMSAIYTGEDNEFIYPDLMMKLQVINSVSSVFVAYQLKTQYVIQYFRNNATGTAGNMPKINQKVVSSTPIVLPSYNEQNEIVRILDELLSKETESKQVAETVISQIDSMKKTVLSKAFRGELGTNDAGEESAVELLKQIVSGNTNEDKPKQKRTTIPTEINDLIKTELEKKIIKLFLKSENGEVSAEEIMKTNSNKFDLIDAINSLKEKK